MKMLFTHPRTDVAEMHVETVESQRKGQEEFVDKVRWYTP